MSADKRTVATDALATLGTIIDDGQKRDAIHLAVEPVIAGVVLNPGEHIVVRHGYRLAGRREALQEAATVLGARVAIMIDILNSGHDLADAQTQIIELQQLALKWFSEASKP